MRGWSWAPWTDVSWSLVASLIRFQPQSRRQRWGSLYSLFTDTCLHNSASCLVFLTNIFNVLFQDFQEIVWTYWNQIGHDFVVSVDVIINNLYVNVKICFYSIFVGQSASPEGSSVLCIIYYMEKDNKLWKRFYFWLLYIIMTRSVAVSFIIVVRIMIWGEAGAGHWSRGTTRVSAWRWARWRGACACVCRTPGPAWGRRRAASAGRGSSWADVAYQSDCTVFCVLYCTVLYCV